MRRPRARGRLAASLRREAGRRATSLLAIANPEPAPGDLPILRFAGFEATDATRHFTRAVMLTAADAGLDRVLNALDDHPFVHFAVHGQFMPDDPTHSGLILGGGRLTLDRLYTRENATAARLTVLSACQTAVTDMRSLPEEAIGLPAALLRAGYAAVVGTLWPVNDVSTALLTMRFYTSLIERAESAGDFHPPPHCGTPSNGCAGSPTGNWPGSSVSTGRYQAMATSLCGTPHNVHTVNTRSPTPIAPHRTQTRCTGRLHCYGS